MISEEQHKISLEDQTNFLKLELQKVLNILDSRKNTTVNALDTMMTNMIEGFSSLNIIYQSANFTINNHSYQRILILRDSLERKIAKAVKELPYNDPIKANKIISRSEIKLLRKFLS